MRSLRKLISMGLHKLFNVPYYAEVSDYELRNIVERDAYFHIIVRKDGLLRLIPGRADSAADHAAGRSFAYYCARELVDFEHDLQSRVKKLPIIETPTLDDLLRETEEPHGFDDYFPEEEETEQPTLLEQYEQGKNGNEEGHENENS